MRVPIDDTHTMHVHYNVYAPPKGVEAPKQDSIPHYEVPLRDEEGKFPKLKIWLKYVDNFPVIREITRVSKPGLRLYKKGKDCKPILNGQGISIMSTSKGIMSDRKCRKENIGGEVLCTVL